MKNSIKHFFLSCITLLTLFCILLCTACGTPAKGEEESIVTPEASKSDNEKSDKDSTDNSAIDDPKTDNSTPDNSQANDSDTDSSTDGGSTPDTPAIGNNAVQNDEELKKIYTFSSTSSGFAITEYKGTQKEIELPSQYDGQNIVAIGANAFCNKDVVSVKLPNTITTIDDNAFSGSSITSITIPENVTHIGNDAFKDCASLKTVEYNAVNCTSGWMKLGRYGSVDSYSSVFGGCNNLSSLKIGDKVKNVPSLLFTSIPELTSISIPKNVETIGARAFSDCESLSSLYYNAANAVIVSINISYNKYDYIFMNSPIKNVEIGPDVTAINSGLLTNCSEIEKINIPDSVTSISYVAFTGCTGIEEIVVGSGIKEISSRLHTGSGSVLGAPNVIKAEFKGLETLSTAVIYKNATLETLILGNIKHIADGCLAGCKGLVNLSVSDGILSVETLSNEGTGFDDCKLLEYNIYNNGKYLGNEDNPYVYFVSFVDENTISTLHPDTKCIGRRAFYQHSINSIELPSGLNSIESYAFAECSSLQSISIPENVCYIGTRAFYKCKSLNDVTLPKKIDFIAPGTFYDCGSIESIVIPNGVTTIDEYAFYSCKKLTSISIPETLTYIVDYAFFDTGNLEQIHIVSISAWCQLTECSITESNASCDLYLNGEKLTKIEIPDGVTYIGAYVFRCMTSLTEVTIPATVTSIKSHAFAGCIGLTKINYEGPKKDWNNISFNNFWDSDSGEYIIYCTDGNIAK